MRETANVFKEPGAGKTIRELNEYRMEMLATKGLELTIDIAEMKCLRALRKIRNANIWRKAKLRQLKDHIQKDAPKCII